MKNLLLILFMLLTPVLYGQTRSVKVSWGRGGGSAWKDSAGFVQTIKEVELAVTTPFSNLAGEPQGLPPLWRQSFAYTGTDLMEIGPYLSTLAGGPWLAWVRVWSDRGVPSAWSKTAQFTFGPQAPVAPEVAVSSMIIIEPPPPPPPPPVISLAAAESGSTSGVNVGTLTLNHACSGTDRLLLAFVANSSSSNVANVLSIRHNGRDLTRKLTYAGQTYYRISLYYLIAPDIGGYPLVLNLSDPDQEVFLGAVSFVGVNQITPLDAEGVQNGQNAAPFVNVASAAGDLVVDFLYSSGIAATPAVGQTAILQRPVANLVIGGISRKPGSAITEMKWTIASARWLMSGVSINPAVGTPVGLNQATLQWSAPTMNADGTPLTDLKDYRIYHGLAPGTCMQTIYVETTERTYHVENLAPGPHYWSVAAVDLSGNISACAAEVSKVIP